MATSILIVLLGHLHSTVPFVCERWRDDFPLSYFWTKDTGIQIRWANRERERWPPPFLFFLKGDTLRRIHCFLRTLVVAYRMHENTNSRQKMAGKVFFTYRTTIMLWFHRHAFIWLWPKTVRLLACPHFLKEPDVQKNILNWVGRVQVSSAGVAQLSF